MYNEVINNMAKLLLSKMAVNVLGRHELMLGNTFVARDNSKSPNKETPPQVDMFLLNFVAQFKI